MRYSEHDKRDSDFLQWVSARLKYVYDDRSGKPDRVKIVAEKMKEGTPLSHYDRGFLKGIAYLLVTAYNDREKDSWIVRLERIATEPEVTQNEGKPPLGIMPRKQCDDLRAKQILEGMERYASKYIPIPLSWVEELKERLYGAE